LKRLWAGLSAKVSAVMAHDLRDPEGQHFQASAGLDSVFRAGLSLRLVAYLDLPSCCALGSADADAHFTTTDAVDVLDEECAEAWEKFRTTVIAIQAQEKFAREAVAMQHEVVADSMVHLAPVLQGDPAAHFGSQLLHMLAELERSAVAQRIAGEAAAAATRQIAEEQARTRVADGFLMTASKSISSACRHNNPGSEHSATENSGRHERRRRRRHWLTEAANTRICPCTPSLIASKAVRRARSS